jgi:succinyl-diaminopimelate desuccinylase
LILGETEKTALRELKKIIKKLKLRSKVTIKRRFTPDPDLEYKPYLFEEDKYIDTFFNLLPAEKGKKKCRFTSSSIGDFNLFATRTKIPTLVFGPGGGNIHSPDEYVNKSEVIDTANYLINFLNEVY